MLFHGLGKKKTKITFLHIQPTEHTSITQKPGFTTGFLLEFDPLICEIRRKGLWKLSRWTEMMLTPSPQKWHRNATTTAASCSSQFPAPLSPSSRDTIHVFGCNWWIRDKFKELPHSHHSNAMLQKEICQRRCLWGLCEGKGCYSNLFTDKEIKFTIPGLRVSVSTESNDSVPRFSINSLAEHGATGANKLGRSPVSTHHWRWRSPFLKNSKGMRVVVSTGLRNIDDVHTSAMVPAWARAQGWATLPPHWPRGQAQVSVWAHRCLPASCLKLSILRATEDTNNVTKVDKEKSHCD